MLKITPLSYLDRWFWHLLKKSTFFTNDWWKTNIVKIFQQIRIKCVCLLWNGYLTCNDNICKITVLLYIWTFFYKNPTCRTHVLDSNYERGVTMVGIAKYYPKNIFVFHVRKQSNLGTYILFVTCFHEFQIYDFFFAKNICFHLK